MLTYIFIKGETLQLVTLWQSCCSELGYFAR
uniref:Uncharacterized protein n=1 Tax=Anguilla anguilla TaxID=7936 RepID=A0A0E9Q6Y4_ANGAN